MGNDDWLKKLEVGDVVIVGACSSWGHASIGKIDRLTKTQIIIGTSRYRRTDGRIVGRIVGESSWGGSWLYEATETKIDEIRHRNRKAKAVNKLRDVDWKTLDIDKLERLVTILDE